MRVLSRPNVYWRSPQIATRIRYIVSSAPRSANPYPYPPNSNPTPHQIFHLPLSASQKEVKARYFELVRIYHPDSPVARAYPSEISEARFHAISASYDVLRGHRPTLDSESPHATPPRFDLHAIWRAKQRHRQDPIGPADDRWKDGVLFGSLLVALGAFVYQISATRQWTASNVLQNSRRSVDGTGFRSPSDRSRDASRDVELLTSPDSSL